MDSILIVDDERGIRETLRAVMEDEGLRRRCRRHR
jgi:DNA-binding NtrC family response regulator